MVTLACLAAKYTSRVGKDASNNNVTFKCNACGKTGTKVRLIDHIAAKPGHGTPCKQASAEAIAECQAFVGKKSAATQPAGAAGPSNLIWSVNRQQPITNFASRTKDEAADRAISMCLAETGTPFNILKQPSVREMVTAIGRAGPAYVPSSYNKFRGRLLDEVNRMRCPCLLVWYQPT